MTKKYRPKVDTSEKKKRKESCNEGGPSKKKKCNHPPSVDQSSIANPTSTNPIDPIVDPTSTNPVDPSFNTSSSPNPNPNPASSSNEDISFFNDDCKHRDYGGFEES
ncbi:unnamed protein product [Ilex paraguariensis]|uniref:Uncharacterized protein n=1 Tax=Ilex paraguariensis TaxID=185542 RepID=A0ABC8SP30_9AQUA